MKQVQEATLPAPGGPRSEKNRTPDAAADKRRTMPVARHAGLSVQDSLQALQTQRSGLADADVMVRRAVDGMNEVAHDKPAPAWLQLLRAFRNPFVLVLLGLAAVSYLTDIQFANPADRDWTGIIIMLTMVTISGLLRFIQEYRSGRAAEKLKSMVRSTATVLRRDSQASEPVRREVPMNELVPGDIVELQAGDMIPADIRLLQSRDLFISQAILTGEALPVEKYDTLGSVSAKRADAKAGENAELLDLANICFMGTNVVSGTATAVVVGTGVNTYFGSLARNVVSTKRVETSFDRGVNSVSWLLIKFMLVMVPIVFVINGVTKGDWVTALTFALAVAVGLTPEMLPMIVSANLAKGAVAMARRKVVVKRLNSVQNFGAMDVLCTDKTGTLTQDRIILEHHFNVDGEIDDEVLRLGWLNSVNQSGQRNLMDRAILARALDLRGWERSDAYGKVDEIPFDFVRRRLSVVVRGADGSLEMITKGAVEEMLAVSTGVVCNGREQPLDAALRKRLLRSAEAYNRDGFRVLVVASRRLEDTGRTQFQTADESGLVVRGFLTFLDPPKDSAQAAIRALNDYGVAVKVLTGDNPIVAAKVCRDVGLDLGTERDGRVMLGSDIEQMDDVALCRRVEKAVLFAKLTPLQKSRVVKALQANGHTVGFLGDGINDAPALRDADVGISVDSGADIAKETADIVLLEKDLMVLEQGVIKGRETFGNILKYLNMTASSNFGNVFSVLVASAWLPWEPMLSLQLLIQNLVYDISQLTLPWDRMDEEFLKKPRKWEAGNIQRFMLWLGPTSSVFDITTYFLMWTVFGAGAAYALHGGDGGQTIMNSGWFIEGLVSQTFVVHMLRTRKIPFLQSTASLPVLLSTTIAIGLACWLPFSPIAESIGFVALPPAYFGWLALTILSYVVLTQQVKTFYIRRYGRWY
ncbi:magnesium-translocating P-type ATPase [Streptomyces cavourensis]|jgi:Mg2+-importing ATPase|uniref:magnesium-translocating P-type ATPase n=1 Tax=unclassified Achromobacter TaxID=2626865 RepID=UPI000E020EE2|nr:magnesium-translocating P-type ATPase [Streptomyces cavourensis]